MIRQRVKLRTPLLAYVVRGLTAVLALGLIWYGLMVVLLAVKVSPHTVNSISANHTLYDDAASLTRADFTTVRRLIAGFAGLIVFFVCLWLARQELPRPYLARGDVDLAEGAQGTTVVRPRAIERVAELAARGSRTVTAAVSRLGDQELFVGVNVSRAAATGEALADVRDRVRRQLDLHGLPALPVNVTLTKYDRKTRRELS